MTICIPQHGSRPIQSHRYRSITERLHPSRFMTYEFQLRHSRLRCSVNSTVNDHETRSKNLKRLLISLVSLSAQSTTTHHYPFHNLRPSISYPSPLVSVSSVRCPATAVIAIMAGQANTRQFGVMGQLTLLYISMHSGNETPMIQMSELHRRQRQGFNCNEGQQDRQFLPVPSNLA